jgi:hypothetical protein
MIAGTMCGGVLIATAALSKNGWLMLLPYVALVTASTIYLRSKNVGPFAKRFVPCMLAFVVATAMVILYIDIVINRRAVADIVLPKLIFPTAFLLLIGAIGSVVVASLTGDRKTAVNRES